MALCYFFWWIDCITKPSFSGVVRPLAKPQIDGQTPRGLHDQAFPGSFAFDQACR
jgi:hypothetical protein